jgi:hypothetical protein
MLICAGKADGAKQRRIAGSMIVGRRIEDFRRRFIGNSVSFRSAVQK